MRLTPSSLTSFVLAAVAGCGGAPAAPSTPGAAASAQPAAPAAAAPAAPARIATGPEAPAAAEEPANGVEPAKSVPAHLQRPLTPTRFAEQLRALGHDPANLPKLETLSVTQKLDVMKLVAEAVGLDCTGCHVSKQDYRSETPRKAVARRMWNELTVGRVLDDGAVFCDSCHQGRVEILDRADREAVKGYMREHYVGRLSTRLGEGADGAAPMRALECSDCHGRPFEPRIIERLWQIPRETRPEGKSQP